MFLAQRTKEDFKRNGLVAVFLRVMEYYAGILFLTTNRIGDFDEAFTSRIHISLYYPELNRDKTIEIFKLNMDMIEERFAKKDRRIDVDRVGIGSFAAGHFEKHKRARWNGRQIRNACQTALALAEFEAQGNSHEAVLRPNAVVKLGVGHFEIVRGAYLEFASYMNKLHGTDEARRAKEGRLRAFIVDEDDRVVRSSSVGGLDKKAAFALASQEAAQQGGGYQQSYHAPQGSFGQQGFQQGFQQGQQSQGYYRESLSTPQPSFSSPGHGMAQQQQQQYGNGQAVWGSPGVQVASRPFQGEGQGQSVSPQPPSTPPPQQQMMQPQMQPQQQQQQQASPAWLNQNIQAMYAASGQGNGQGSMQGGFSGRPNSGQAWGNGQ